MTRITQIDHEWLNIPMKSISLFRNRFDRAYRYNMHIAIIYPKEAWVHDESIIEALIFLTKERARVNVNKSEL